MLRPCHAHAQPFWPTRGVTPMMELCQEQTSLRIMALRACLFPAALAPCCCCCIQNGQNFSKADFERHPNADVSLICVTMSDVQISVFCLHNWVYTMKCTSWQCQFNPETSCFSSRSYGVLHHITQTFFLDLKLSTSYGRIFPRLFNSWTQTVQRDYTLPMKSKSLNTYWAANLALMHLCLREFSISAWEEAFWTRALRE